jgi:hypothetical protein
MGHGCPVDTSIHANASVHSAAYLDIAASWDAHDNVGSWVSPAMTWAVKRDLLGERTTVCILGPRFLIFKNRA